MKNIIIAISILMCIIGCRSSMRTTRYEALDYIEILDTNIISYKDTTLNLLMMSNSWSDSSLTYFFKPKDSTNIEFNSIQDIKINSSNFEIAEVIVGVHKHKNQSFVKDCSIESNQSKSINSITSKDSLNSRDITVKNSTILSNNLYNDEKIGPRIFILILLPVSVICLIIFIRRITRDFCKNI